MYTFWCKCGSSLMLATRVRPVCRVCGSQMKLEAKVKGPVSYVDVSAYNRLNGTATWLAEHSPDYVVVKEKV